MRTCQQKKPKSSMRANCRRTPLLSRATHASDVAAGAAVGARTARKELSRESWLQMALSNTHAKEATHATAVEQNRPFEAARIDPTPLEPHEHAASGETALEKPGSAESHRRRSTVREPALASHDHPNDYRDPMSQPPEPIEPTEPIVSSSTEAER